VEPQRCDGLHDLSGRQPAGRRQHLHRRLRQRHLPARSQFVDAPINGAGLHWPIVDGYRGNCGTYTLSYSM
jgi:hypothetical protein